MASAKSTTANSISYLPGSSPCYTVHLSHRYNPLGTVKTAKDFLKVIKNRSARIVTISLTRAELDDPLAKEVLELPCELKVETTTSDGKRAVFMVFVNQPKAKKGAE